MEGCIVINDQTTLEVSLPVATHLAFRIQNAYYKLQEDLEAVLQERAPCSCYKMISDMLISRQPSKAKPINVLNGR